MTRYRTPWRFNAASSARSAGVSAKSSTSKSRGEALRWRQLKRTQCVVQIGGVGIGITPGDLVRAAPQPFRFEGPRALIGREVPKRVVCERGFERVRHRLND